jgi:hypothetical protein
MTANTFLGFVNSVYLKYVAAFLNSVTGNCFLSSNLSPSLGLHSQITFTEDTTGEWTMRTPKHHKKRNPGALNYNPEETEWE